MTLPSSLHLKPEILEKKQAGRGQAAAGPDGSQQPQEASLKALPTEDGSLPHRAVPELDEESPHGQVLVMPIQDADAGACPQKLPPLEGPTSRYCGKKFGGKSGGGSAGSRSRTSSPRRGSVLYFLSTTEMGKLVSVDEDAQSEASEWERRERREGEEERRQEAAASRFNHGFHSSAARPTLPVSQE